MKTPILPTKRQPVARGLLHRFHVNAAGRKQRVAATATASDIEGADVPNLSVGRALLVILILHIVAIGGILAHNLVMDRAGKDSAPGGASQAVAQRSHDSEKLPVIGKNDATYMVGNGDSYQSIAQGQGVDESALRELNGNVPARAGRVFKLPPKRIVAVNPPERAALLRSGDDTGRGMVEQTAEVPEVAVTGVPKAIIVHPNKSARAQTTSAPASSSTSSGHTCVVAQGDSIWKIASRNKVTPAALMKANGITDPKKIKPGTKLVLPSGH